eukprot:TRINITY_DN12823_c0_g1_i1.p1 TRINITY_DN12823_c0_g1~~TRINITY_DN12823_c0_g1_i1.p1  ORF type:complete len:265 (-),score=88.83 TRINITY_DN12823_c0_g1_i1:207-953(-)
MVKHNWNKVQGKGVEYAKSGRASCRICKSKLLKGEVRVDLMEVNPFGDGPDDLTSKFYHPFCVDYKAIGVKKVEDIPGSEDLKKKDLDTLKKLVKEGGLAATASAPPTDSKTTGKKRKATASEKALEESKKKARKSLTAAQKKTIKDVEKKKEEFKSFTNDQLKTLLRINATPVTGNKSVLIERVADGAVRGAIPKCTKCFGGNLTYHEDDDLYTCKGYMDDDHFHRCSAKIKGEDLTRATWKDKASD